MYMGLCGFHHAVYRMERWKPGTLPFRHCKQKHKRVAV
jgi:hypothetical protein